MVVYKLELPFHVKDHPVFHVSRLKEYVDPATFDPDRPVPPRPEPDFVDGEPEYEVEKILDRRGRHPNFKYLVKWEGYPDSDNSWEPINNLRNAKDLIEEFEATRT